MKTLLLALLFLPIAIQAQVSPNVSKHYPAHIVYKIDDLVSKVNLEEDKQIKIAEKFLKSDSIANASLHNGGSVAILKDYNTVNKSFLKEILSRDELEHFAYEMDKDNRFLIALNSISYLKLNPTQISIIRHLNDSLDTTPKRSMKENIQFYNLKLYKTLDKLQYIELIKISYKDQSLADAKSDWDRIMNLKINTPGKEKEEFQQIIDFHFAKNSFLDKKADRHEKKMRDFFDLKASLMEPPLLIRANILSNQKYANNKYASIIQYEKELNLTQGQIDSLLVKYQQLEKIIIENRQNDLKEVLTPHKPLPSEFENFSKIISSDQISKWLTLKNKKEAIKKAHISWANLEKEGLTKNIDKNKTISALAIYHIKLLIALEQSKNSKTKENQFLVRDIEQKKPDVLQQLDAITRSKAKNANSKNELSW